MPLVPIQLVELLSSDPPGFVVACLTDAFGVDHFFHDKVPVFADSPIDADTPLPVGGWLGCTVLERFVTDGRELIRIDTEHPWDVESTKGDYHFVVSADVLRADS